MALDSKSASAKRDLQRPFPTFVHKREIFEGRTRKRKALKVMYFLSRPIGTAFGLSSLFYHNCTKDLIVGHETLNSLNTYNYLCNVYCVATNYMRITSETFYKNRTKPQFAIFNSTGFHYVAALVGLFVSLKIKSVFLKRIINIVFVFGSEQKKRT